jgi:hypothetical protein
MRVVKAAAHEMRHKKDIARADALANNSAFTRRPHYEIPRFYPAGNVDPYIAHCYVTRIAHK